MGFFNALGKLGKAAVGTALLPVDAVRDVAARVVDPFEEDGAHEDHAAARIEKIGNNVSDALDEIDD